MSANRILTKVINDFKELANIPLEFVLKNYVQSPYVANKEETIKKIIAERASVSRYGDGELDIILGKDLVFQPFHKELASKLKEILRFEDKCFLVCLPDVFGSLDIYTSTTRDYWKIYIRRNRRKWYRYIKKDKLYYNSFITRFYIIFEDKALCFNVVELLKLIWGDRDIVFIEGEKSRLGVGNNLFDNAKSIRRILCPAVNAFSKYEKIMREVHKIDQDTLFLIALGPTATVLAFDLYRLGYQAIDIGHLDIEYEWYLMRANKKVAITNKYVNEVSDGREIGELKNEDYYRQVIARVN